MRVIRIACVVMVAACGGKDRDKACERYIAMSQKCSADAKPFDVEAEKKMCVAVESGGSDGPYYEKMHGCALQTEDCEAFAKCVDAAIAENAKAPAAQAAQATELTLEIVRAATSAIKGVNECDAQVAKLAAALEPLATKSTELKGLVKDLTVFDAVNRSHRVGDAAAALKKASACKPVLDVMQKAIIHPFF
jgi:hypothetical protein